MQNRIDILNEIEQANKNVVLAEIKLVEFDLNKPKWAEKYDDFSYCYLSDKGFSRINENKYAYNKLQNLRHQIIQDWIPDYNNENEPKYSTNFFYNKLCKITLYCTFDEFTFETAEQRDWFMDKHIDLLKVYYGVTDVPSK